jgi:hypothetical protein
MKRIKFFYQRAFYKDFGDNKQMYLALGFPDKNASQEAINEAIKSAMLTLRPPKVRKVKAGSTNQVERSAISTDNLVEVAMLEAAVIGEGKGNNDAAAANEKTEMLRKVIHSYSCIQSDITVI